MGLFSMFKSATKKFQREVRKFESSEVLDAFIGASMLMSVAETKTTPPQDAIDVIKTRIKANPSTAHFDNTEVNEICSKYVSLFANGYSSARLNITRALHSVRDNAQFAEDVMAAVVSEAERDGNISDAEVEMLEYIGAELSLNPADFIG